MSASFGLIDRHTRLPWGMEITENDIWIGPMHRDGMKVDDIAVNLDYDSTYTEEARARILANAHLIVNSVNTNQKLRESHGFFTNGMAYYTTFPDNEEDGKQLRKDATYHFLRARNHVGEKLDWECHEAAKAIFAEEFKPEMDRLAAKLWGEKA